MQTFKVKLVGYDTCEFNHTYKVIEIEAENEEEAKKKAEEWCKENSYMGGNEWYFECFVKEA